MATETQKCSIVLVTGPSGAGRSTAIDVFEDLGFEAIDNMPLALLPKLTAGPPPGRPIALGIDVRTRDFSVQNILEAREMFTASDAFETALLFLDCSTDALLRRYSETRRRHPMAPDDAPIRGIETEHSLLRALRSRADVLIDTTALSPHDLKGEITRLFGTAQSPGLALTIQSFSYKRGVPRGIDMVLDCRFLRNPYWQPGLRAGTGLDPAVRTHVTGDPLFGAFFAQLRDLSLLLLPAYRDEGKAHFSIGLGCSGGRHRSVTTAEALASALRGEGWQVSVRHRELERQGVARSTPDETCVAPAAPEGKRA
ncbi:MAG: RNase adapter RapZ [Pseudomonadota bacterium]